MSIERDIMKVLAASLFLLMGCERAASKKDDPVLRECLQYLSDSGVDLNSDDFSWYADFCKVVRNYTHEKLTVYEIMAATDKLSDVLAMKPLPGFEAFGTLRKGLFSRALRVVLYIAPFFIPIVCFAAMFARI